MIKFAIQIKITIVHHNNTLNLSKEEMVFNEFINHGDDFIKIQIYRNAREYYSQALETNFNNELADKKLVECNALIKSESKAIIAIVSIMAVVEVVLILI